MNQQNQKEQSALIIVDIQNDFCEGGSLEVKNACKVIEKTNTLRQRTDLFSHIFLTMDFHPQNHVSFASNHPGHQCFTTIELQNGKKQELWPDHCVQNTKGCDIHKDLNVLNNDIIIHKGIHQDIDSYSGFGSQGENTGLLEKLQQLNIKTVFVCGLAYDFCVKWTSIDAAKNGFQVFVVRDATEYISKEGEQSTNEEFAKYQNIKLVYLEKL